MSTLEVTGVAFGLFVAIVVGTLIFVDWRLQKRLREELKRDLAGRR